MLRSVDHYVLRQLQGKLRQILANPKIVRDLLSEIDDEIKNPFIDYYCGEKNLERNKISVSPFAPQEKQPLQNAVVFVRYGDGESREQIGNIMNDYDYKDNDTYREMSIVQANEDQTLCYLEVSHTIANKPNVVNIDFASGDDMYVEDNRIYFNFDPVMLGVESLIIYSDTTDDEVNGETVDGRNMTGLQKGFSAQETIIVAALSVNANTVMMLDLMLRGIMILMRDNMEEQLNLVNPRLSFFQNDARMEFDEEDPTQLVYSRNIAMTYTTDYTLDQPMLEKIKEIIID